jgi:hypothetical protein
LLSVVGLAAACDSTSSTTVLETVPILDAGPGGVDARPPASPLDTDGDGIPDAVEAHDPFMPADVDGDGQPNELDPDSDGDAILDGDERMANGIQPDADGDGTPDWADDDSDGDGLPDDVEAGDGDMWTPPVDTDHDGWPDYRDLDSDQDGLPDADEPGHGSSPVLFDTDDDGASDFIEAGTGTDPRDAADNPDARGYLVFVTDYMVPPEPDRLSIRVELRGRADVGVVVGEDGERIDPPGSAFAWGAVAGARGRTVRVVARNGAGAGRVGYAAVDRWSEGCTTESPVVDANGDGRDDTFADVPAHTPVCFEVVPAQNDTVWPDVSLIALEAEVVVLADEVEVDVRRVFFLVPPPIPTPGWP